MIELSIAIATYNRKHLLEKTLHAIIDQLVDEKKIEIVVVDNCSTDGTKEMIFSVFSTKMHIIKYFQNDENIGAERNVIKAISLCKGKYVKLLNDNKLLIDGSINELLQIIKKDNPAVLFTPNKIDKNGTAKEVINSVDEIVKKASFFITWLPCLTLKTELIKKINLLNGLGTNLPQTQIMFDILAIECTFIIHWGEIFIDLDRGNKGGYNILETFVKNYILILKGQMASGLLSRNIFISEKRKLLFGFIFPWITTALIIHRKKYSFHFDNMFNYIVRYFNFQAVYFLFFPLWFMKYIFLHLVRKTGQ